MLISISVIGGRERMQSGMSWRKLAWLIFLCGLEDGFGRLRLLVFNGTRWFRWNLRMVRLWIFPAVLVLSISWALRLRAIVARQQIWLWRPRLFRVITTVCGFNERIRLSSGKGPDWTEDASFFGVFSSWWCCLDFGSLSVPLFASGSGSPTRGGPASARLRRHPRQLHSGEVLVSALSSSSGCSESCLPWW